MKGQTYFPTVTPESVGIPSASIAKLLDAMEREDVQLNSIMILRHGKVCAQGWYAPYGPDILHTMYSFTKTVCSSAIGLLVSEGKLSLDDKVISFFPESAPEDPCENLREMAVRHLLSMTCGHESEPSRAGTDWVYDFLHHPVPRKPGTHFVYNTVGTYMLAAILHKVTGVNMTEYLRPRFFEPLGITEYYCSTCPKGIEQGGSGLCLRTEDMAKIAQLYLQKGQWEGKQILPAAWIEEATTAKIMQGDGWYPVIKAGMEDYFSGYGYQLWVNSIPTSYRLDGLYAQLGVVLPKYDMVVITTAATCRIAKLLTTLWRCLLPAVFEAPLPEDPAAHEALEQKLASLQIPWGKGTTHSPREAAISGRPVIFPRNHYTLIPQRNLRFAPLPANISPEDKGLQKLSVEFLEDATARLRFTEWGSETVLALGFGAEKLPGEVRLPNLERNVLGSYCWEDDNTMRIDLLHINSSNHRVIRLTFDDLKGVYVLFTEHPNDIDASVDADYIPDMGFTCHLL